MSINSAYFWLFASAVVLFIREEVLLKEKMGYSAKSSIVLYFVQVQMLCYNKLRGLINESY